MQGARFISWWWAISDEVRCSSRAVARHKRRGEPTGALCAASPRPERNDTGKLHQSRSAERSAGNEKWRAGPPGRVYLSRKPTGRNDGRRRASATLGSAPASRSISATTKEQPARRASRRGVFPAESLVSAFAPACRSIEQHAAQFFAAAAWRGVQLPCREHASGGTLREAMGRRRATKQQPADDRAAPPRAPGWRRSGPLRRPAAPGRSQRRRRPRPCGAPSLRRRKAHWGPPQLSEERTRIPHGRWPRPGGAGSRRSAGARVALAVSVGRARGRRGI